MHWTSSLLAVLSSRTWVCAHIQRHAHRRDSPPVVCLLFRLTPSLSCALPAVFLLHLDPPWARRSCAAVAEVLLLLLLNVLFHFHTPTSVFRFNFTCWKVGQSVVTRFGGRTGKSFSVPCWGSSSVPAKSLLRHCAQVKKWRACRCFVL